MNPLLRSQSLRSQLVLLIGLLLLAVAVFLIAFFPQRFEDTSRTWVERRAVGMAQVLSNAVAPGLEFEDPQNVRDLLVGLQDSKDALFAVVRRVNGSTLAVWNVSTLPSRREIKETPVVSIEGDVLRVDAPVQTRVGAHGVLTVGFSLNELKEEQESQLATVLWVSAGILTVGLILAFLMGQFLVRPIQMMTDVALRIASGDLSQAELVTSRADEIGQMATAFNRMLRSLRVLSAAAERMGKGDLTGRIELAGMVGEAFNRMLDEQRAIVRQIAAVSAQLASAAGQIYAAAQEQEATAASQSTGVTEVTSTIQSLLESASHIADSARGVLANAELTHQTADETSQRISELSGHANRMGELLEIIRDIADRSDLLALNASLEATRAGDMGRAFSLVAQEIRRLAERVTASVQDVKALVEDVRSSGNATVMANDQARKLADSTTGSARHITLLTQQQRTGTEQVSDSMNQISSLLNRSVASAHQTRAAAETLKSEAERLSELVVKFRIETGELP